MARQLGLKTLALGDDLALPEGDPSTLPPAPDADTRWIYFSSGTTADPKGAKHSDASLIAACHAKAIAWYGDDRDAPARFEPSGTDFLSPSLVEAELMRRVLDASAFAEWLAAFLPRFVDGQPRELFTPVNVDDRADAQLVHLDGLNLSRAWCLRGIACSLPSGDPRIAIAQAAAARHLAAGWEGFASDAFVGAHWLATFALLALEA